MTAPLAFTPTRIKAGCKYSSSSWCVHRFRIMYVPYQICRRKMVTATYYNGLYAVNGPPEKLPTSFDSLVLQKKEDRWNINYPANDGVFEGLDWNFPIAKLHGFLHLEYAGSYEMCLESLYGSRLLLNRQLILDHDGGYSNLRKCVKTSPQTAGIHEIEVHFIIINRTILIMKWESPENGELTIVPGNVWSKVCSCNKYYMTI